MNELLPSNAPVSEMANITREITVRAVAPGDQLGTSVWPNVRVERAPQYRFIAFAVATPTERTINTNGARPSVTVARPATRLPLGAARPTTAPSTMGKIDPSEQPQELA